MTDSAILKTISRAIRAVIPLRVQFKIGDIYSCTKLPLTERFSDAESQAWQWFMATEDYDRTRLEKEQWAIFKSILEYAYCNVPYYRKKYDSCGVKPEDVACYEDLPRLPLIEKEELKENFEDFIARDSDRTRCHLKQTSGTTGSPTRILLDEEGYRSYALVVRWYRNLARTKVGDRWVFVRRKEFKSTKEAAAYRGRYFPPANCLHFASHNLKDEAIAEYVRKLLLFKPRFIEGNSSDIYFIASYMRENKLRVHIPVVITRTDALLEHHKPMLMEVFGPTDIFNFYGSVEQVASGMDCQLHHGKHQNMLFNMVEVLDDNKRQVFETSGSIVGTNLRNRAMPLIRYRIGDRGILSKRTCVCGKEGWQLLKIEGREGDVLILPNGSRIAPGFIGTAPAVDLFGIKEYQLVQKRIDHIVLNVSLVKGIDHSVAEQLRENLIRLFQYEGEMAMEIVDHIPRIANKFRVIVSELNNEGSVK